jgi:hypothetical protein
MVWLLLVVFFTLFGAWGVYHFGNKAMSESLSEIKKAIDEVPGKQQKLKIYSDMVKEGGRYVSPAQRRAVTGRKTK